MTPPAFSILNLVAPLESHLDSLSKVLHRYMHPVLLRRNTIINEAPSLWRDPCLAEAFPLWGFGCRPAEFREQAVLGGSRGKLCLLPR